MNYLRTDSADNPELRKLLHENVIGTPGKSMVYQHCTVDAKLEHIADPRFVSVSIRHRIIGTCCFCRREVYNTSERVTAYYLRYFTFRASYRVSPNQATTATSNSSLKKEVKHLLTGEVFSESDPHVFYAYIDPDNLRSIRQASQFGFQQIGQFRTVFVSRFSPRKCADVQTPLETEKELIINKLKEAYASHTFLGFENIFYQNNYLVYVKNGEIIAGLQANPEQWKVHELPGKNGRFLLKVVSAVPFLKRIFNKDFSFLSVEGVFCDPGQEQAVELLIEEAMARHKVYSAIFCLDPASPEYRLIKRIRGGALRALSAERSFSVVAKTNKVKISGENPVYVSAFDVM